MISIAIVSSIAILFLDTYRGRNFRYRPALQGGARRTDMEYIFYVSGAACLVGVSLSLSLPFTSVFSVKVVKTLQNCVKMASPCAKCNKTVYKAEELKCLDKVMHNLPIK